MYRFLTGSLIVLLAVSVTIPLVAQDKKKKKRRRQQQPQQVRTVLKKLDQVELTSEQKTKIDKLTAEYSGKLKAANDKLGDGSKKAATARKKASKEGKKGRQLQAAINAALTEEQQAALKDRQSASRQYRAAVARLLTAEQREKSGLQAGRAGAKKKARKKKNKGDG